jgi:hypothetical protein
MAKRAVKHKPGKPVERQRSAKAGVPPRATAGSPQARRRRKSARASLSKGTTIFETDHGPRAAWPASVSKKRKKS